MRQQKNKNPNESLKMNKQTAALFDGVHSFLTLKPRFLSTEPFYEIATSAENQNYTQFYGKLFEYSHSEKSLKQTQINTINSPERYHTNQNFSFYDYGFERRYLTTKGLNSFSFISSNNGISLNVSYTSLVVSRLNGGWMLKDVITKKSVFSDFCPSTQVGSVFNPARGN